ncbi:MAG: phosphonoacetaldehyde hydrolase [Phyllobacteriaceae bacterium]|nr:phosphonoacetaldehyde hydrolase [Phyllobacteriaceae bacterium]MBA91078.1 phosphonoacetaldehyde hydrolase [Phyllobacteriaceae bacterium]
MGSVSHLGYFGERAGRKANPFPRRVLIGAMALLAFSAAAIVFGQVTGIGTVRQNPGAPVAMRDIVLARMPDGGVSVTDAVTGAGIARYGQNEGGFVNGSLRGFERMRAVAKTPLETPYRLIKWQAGMVSLSDTATGERIYLDPFGKDNAAAFEALLGQYGRNEP